MSIQDKRNHTFNNNGADLILLGANIWNKRSTVLLSEPLFGVAWYPTDMFIIYQPILSQLSANYQPVVSIRCGRGELSQILNQIIPWIIYILLE